MSLGISKDLILTRPSLSPIRLQSAWSDVARLMKDFAGSQREFAQSQSFFDLLIRTYIARAGDRRSTLVFCPTVIAAKHMTDSFTRAGIRARYVCNDTPKPECRGIVDDFNAGRFEVLVNCKMFTEGVDMPGVSCSGRSRTCYTDVQIDAVILGNPTRTQNVVNQMVSRKCDSSVDSEAWSRYSTFARYRQDGLYTSRYVRCLRSIRYRRKAQSCA